MHPSRLATGAHLRTATQQVLFLFSVDSWQSLRSLQSGALKLDEKRRDPDSLLELAQSEERLKTKGKLKIFFGASPGVGKTYGMLEAARARKKEGKDVLIGIVETHKRKETEALIEGLEILPVHFIEYKNTKLREFDVDAAIARRPGLILIDELAHTNAPGSKNAKRWQDVNDILDAGIDVYSTVNVQHVESLNDVVAQITGVIVRETIPDSIVERADEIELIDLPPDDLLQRMKEGRVYLGDQAERAAQNFFRKGNLIALRELALRCTADRVNRQVQSFRQEKAIDTTWPTAERILVCISPSPFSARLVRSARRMAAALRAEWIAVYVETPALAAMDDKSRQQVKQNLKLAEQLGAKTVTLTGHHFVDEIVEFARARNVSKIITGKPDRPRWRDLLFGSGVDQLIRKSADIDVYVIKGDPDASHEPRTYSVQATTDNKKYVFALATILLCTLISYILFAIFKHDNANLDMVYLLGVVFVATSYGRGPAIFSSILSVAAFDFFFVDPLYSFAVSDTKYLITFAIMLIVALLISSLTAQIQRHAQAAGVRELRMSTLYSLSRELSSARGPGALVGILARHAAQLFDAEVIGLLPDAEGRLMARAGNESTFPFGARERGVAQWVSELGRPAGMGTDTLAGAEALYVPLNATRGIVGVLGLHPRQGRALTAEQMTLLETCAAQTALAVEIDRLGDETRKAQVEAETEKSRSALLSCVSHDLRTPLASICGAASSLLDQGQTLPENTKMELVQTISDEGTRLARLISNLLEMTKLESGAVQMRKEWCPLEEVVGSALTRMEKTLIHHPVKTVLPGDLPMVPVDVVLIEQVFINLLENAVKYTPEGSPIEISATLETREVVVRIADRGPGLPPGDEKKIFDKFYRGKAREGTSGVGLGLTICRAIVEAHGGKIRAENRASGAVFVFSIPLDGDVPKMAPAATVDAKV